MQIPVELDRSLSQPLATQLADQLRRAIRQGRIPPGARLPSSRKLAEQLNLGRNTVVRVYETLTIEGLAESRAASGFFVTPEQVREWQSPSSERALPSVTVAMPIPKAPRVPHRLETRASSLGRSYDFVPGRPDPELFPVKMWRRLLQKCLAYRGASGFSERGATAGLYELRSAIATHVSMSRGVVADPAQILIVSGIGEGLSLVARMLLGPSTSAVVEDPCYEAALCKFEATGATILGVPVDEDGLVTARLPEQSAALLYVTPAHQYPTGRTLAPSRRRELIAWARQSGCYLVEDDYDGDFQFDGSPELALAGMAPDCTIHLGTFSTTLGPGLRLGYVVVPPNLVDPMRATKLVLGGESPWLEQAALAEFLQNGSYSLHVTRCRAQYKESRDALLGALARHFGSVDVSGEGSGLHLFWQLPAGVPEASTLEALGRQFGVGVYSLAAAGVRTLATPSESGAALPSHLARRSLVLGYAGMPPEQIEQGIALLSDAVDETLDDHHDFVGELLLDEPPPHRPRPVVRQKRSARAANSTRDQPAHRTVLSRRARSKKEREDTTPMRIIRGIYRYPIKGLSPQPVRGIVLEAGKPFPFDRVFAMVRPGVAVNPEAPRWAKKGLFLMLMLEHALASVQTHLDPETLQFTVMQRRPEADASRPRTRNVLNVNLGTPEGRASVEAFFQRLVPKLEAAPSLVRSADGHFMDKPDSVMSCVNLATVRSLEKQWGCSVDPLRFRANFYIEGARAWEEFDWVGSDIQLGDVLFRVDRRNGRCGATNVNPATGERDMDIPGSLRKAFGHKDLGIYLVARSGGKVVVGDKVNVPDLVAATADSASPAPSRAPLPACEPGAFICRGCYYIFIEAQGASGVEPGTAFDAIAPEWRCPDCGTEKTNFQPYLAEPAAESA